MKKLILLMTVALLAKNTNAQWQTGGPANEIISCLAAGGSNVYANDGINGGIYVSTNYGGSWAHLDSVALVNIYVLSLATSGSNIYAGTTDGIYVSSNDGTTWVPGDTGLPANTRVNTLAISGSDIFAGTFGNGVFLSTNNGTRWKEVNTGLTDTSITALAISGSNIFAGTLGGGVFVSGDNGSHWTAVNTGITDLNIYTIAISGADIFAGTEDGYIFLSNNNGASWKQVFSIEFEIKSIAASDNDVYAGLYGGGVFLSTDTGGSWNQVNQGLGNLYINALTINNSIVFAGTFEGGVWQEPVAVITTGTQEINKPSQADFILYPNPSNGSFIVETNNTGAQLLQVFDITGKLTLAQAIQNSKTQIDASSLANGIYSVRLLRNDGVENEKLVIVK